MPASALITETVKVTDKRYREYKDMPESQVDFKNSRDAKCKTGPSTAKQREDLAHFAGEAIHYMIEYMKVARLVTGIPTNLSLSDEGEINSTINILRRQLIKLGAV